MRWGLEWWARHRGAGISSSGVALVAFLADAVLDGLASCGGSRAVCGALEAGDLVISTLVRPGSAGGTLAVSSLTIKSGSTETPCVAGNERASADGVTITASGVIGLTTVRALAQTIAVSWLIFQIPSMLGAIRVIDVLEFLESVALKNVIRTFDKSDKALLEGPPDAKHED